MSRCHPSIRSSASAVAAGRCLPKEVYEEAAKTTKTTKTASKSVYAAVGCEESADHCLLDKMRMPDEKKKELRTRYLRPRKPKAWEKDPDAWLDNFNIAEVMGQYQEAFPWFRFLGVFPIDFSAPDPYRSKTQKNASPQCLYKETCNIRLQEEYRRGVRGIGMIFNLDPHDKSGSHWVALYINLHNIKRPFIGYFDSYGYETPEMIARLMKSFTLEIKTCKLAYNARRFQFGQSECGMFSMYFLICMIHGISFEDFCKDAVHDKTMLDLRNILFAH